MLIFHHLSSSLTPPPLSSSEKFGDLQEGDSRISGAEAMMVGCAGKCVDTHVAMLPSLKKNVLSKIEDIERQIPR
jgi:hypothetical protein